MARVDVLIPTYQRKTGLAIVLTSLLGQTFTDFDVIISDQTRHEDVYLHSMEIQNELTIKEIYEGTGIKRKSSSHHWCWQRARRSDGASLWRCRLSGRLR